MSAVVQSSSSSPSGSSAGSVKWEVADILAERTRPNGQNECLVVWKPSWEPLCNIPSGSVWTFWKLQPKWLSTAAEDNFQVALGRTYDETLSRDCIALDKTRRKAVGTKRPPPAPSGDRGTRGAAVSKHRDDSLPGSTSNVHTSKR